MGFPTSGGPRKESGIADLWQALRALARDVDYLRSAQNLVGRAALAAGRSLVLHGGGSLEIEGGDVVLRSASGQVLFHLGRIHNNLGQNQAGWIVSRDGDGSTALAMYDADIGPEGIQQALNWFDRTGHVVLADDTNGGQGLARPYVPFFVSTRFDAVGTSSSTWDTLQTLAGHWQHPRAAVAITASTSEATTGEVQLVDGDGVVLAGPTVIGAGQSIAPFWTVTLPPHQHMAYRYLNVQARRTGGTGEVWARTYYAGGVQT